MPPLNSDRIDVSSSDVEWHWRHGKAFFNTSSILVIWKGSRKRREEHQDGCLSCRKRKNLYFPSKFQKFGLFLLNAILDILLQGRLSTISISLPGIGVFKYHAPHSCAPSLHTELGADPIVRGWHLQGLGESESKLSHSLSPYPPYCCLWLGFLSALFMSR